MHLAAIFTSKARTHPRVSLLLLQMGRVSCDEDTLSCPSLVDLSTEWWGQEAETIHASPITESPVYAAALDPSRVANRTVHVVVHLYEPAASPIREPQAHVCLSRTRIDTMRPAATHLECTSCASSSSFVTGNGRTFYAASTSQLTLGLPPFSVERAPLESATLLLLAPDPPDPPDAQFPAASGLTCASAVSRLLLRSQYEVHATQFVHVALLLTLSSAATPCPCPPPALPSHPNADP